MRLEEVETKTLSALKIGEGVSRLVTISTRSDLRKLFDLHALGERLHIVGDGTNTVFGLFSGIAVRLNLHGFDWLNEHTLKIAGGESWQRAVDLTVEKNLHGIERLTKIPGTVGAAPVQNIGAFGQLLSDRLASIEVYDYALDKILVLEPGDCNFGAHRASKFKSAEWSTYIIIGITLSLLGSKEFQPPIGEGLMLYAKEHSLVYSDIKSASALIASFRGTLYPDYILTPNCGSYFTNFEMSNDLLGSLPESIWQVNHKVSRSGEATMFQCKELLKSVGIDSGYSFSGGLMMHPKFNNFLINPGGNATPNDLLLCHEEVNTKLREAYGIELIPEPEFVRDTTVDQER